MLNFSVCIRFTVTIFFQLVNNLIPSACSISVTHLQYVRLEIPAWNLLFSVSLALPHHDEFNFLNIQFKIKAVVIFSGIFIQY